MWHLIAYIYKQGIGSLIGRYGRDIPTTAFWTVATYSIFTAATKFA
jgi:hypothetical protein